MHGLIVSAYSVYPSTTAEGVVNAALLDALRKQFEIGLLTSPAGYEPLTADRDNLRPISIFGDPSRDAVVGFADHLCDWLGRPKHDPRGAAARLVDHVLRRANQMPLQMRAWSTHASTRLTAWLQEPFPGAPVWARGTPPESFQAAILAYRRRPFPLVVNYNDPMPHCLLWGEKVGTLTPALDRLQHRQNRFHAAFAQAFTFPSRRLAELMIAAAGFDPRRCFVIPHLTPLPHAKLMVPLPSQCGFATDANREPPPTLFYGGTFYGSVFPEPVREGLEMYAREGGRIRFVFVLKEPPMEALAWLQQRLPTSRVYCNLSPVQTSALASTCDAVLVSDAERHAPLLRNKTAEAVRLQRVLFALTPAHSTTADVARRAGGIAVEPVSAEAVAGGLRQLEGLLLDAAALAAGREQREQVQARFSDERIVADSMAVLDYACRRFAWQQAGGGETEPEPPQIEMWP